MRVYLDNCCYNRPFDAVGPVDAERFVSIVTNAGFDYTEWQRGLFEGETVDSLFEKVKSFNTNKELCC